MGLFNHQFIITLVFKPPFVQVWAHNHWSFPQQKLRTNEKSIKWQKLSSLNMCTGLWYGIEHKLTPGNMAAGNGSD